MSDYNQQTLESYDRTVTAFYEKSPQEVSGVLQTWIDDNLQTLPTDARIIEIGTGTGKDADYIESQGYTVERTDASQGFIDFLTDHGHQARELDVLTDDLGSDYDMVFANCVLLHFTREDTAMVMKKVFGALTPGGRFAFVMKLGEGEEVSEDKLGAPRFFCYWQQDDLEELVETTGFASCEVTYQPDYRTVNARAGTLLLTALKGEE